MILSVQCFRNRLNCGLSGKRRTAWKPFRRRRNCDPDIILMDIGLPGLNGIETACRIRKLSINSKIVLVTANRDLDMIKEAFFSGVNGYVLKYAARTQLLPAVKAVMQGERFLCPCLRRDPPKMSELST